MEVTICTDGGYDDRLILTSRQHSAVRQAPSSQTGWLDWAWAAQLVRYSAGLVRLAYAWYGWETMAQNPLQLRHTGCHQSSVAWSVEYMMYELWVRMSTGEYGWALVSTGEYGWAQVSAGGCRWARVGAGERGWVVLFIPHTNRVRETWDGLDTGLRCSAVFTACS